MDRNGGLFGTSQSFPWFIYVPVLFLLLLKFIYNYLLTVLCILLLYGKFLIVNRILMVQTSKSQPPDIAKLYFALVKASVGIAFVYYDGSLFKGLICNQTYPSPLHAGDLLWYISMTDITFKLIIVLIKILITLLLPISILNYSQRGKLFLFIESVCQTYSAILPLPPWMRYWCDTHESGDKCIALLLGTLYLITKTTFILFKLRILQRTTYNLMHGAIIGEQPNKALLDKLDNECSICRDTFNNPRILDCNHIFCRSCIQTWLNQVQSCPICRSNISEAKDEAASDGSTSIWIQLF